MDTQKEVYKTSFLALLVLAMLVNILSQAVHETGHHAAYQATGHEPVWAFTKLVQLWETPPINPKEWVEKINLDGSHSWFKLSSPITSSAENTLAAAAGPLAGLLGAAIGLVIARRSRKAAWKQIGLAFTLSASIVAVLYYLRSPIRTGGDEYDIATYLGLQKWIIEILFALAFFACLSFALRELPSWKIRGMWLGAILLGGITTGLPMALLDPLIINQINAGNPLFQPLLGYSVPVFLTIVLALVGVWFWARWQDRDELFTAYKK